MLGAFALSQGLPYVQLFELRIGMKSPAIMAVLSSEGELEGRSKKPRVLSAPVKPNMATCSSPGVPGPTLKRSKV